MSQLLIINEFLRLVDLCKIYITEEDEFKSLIPNTYNGDNEQLIMLLSRIDISKLSYDQRVKYYRPESTVFMKILKSNQNPQVRTLVWNILSSSITLNNVTQKDPNFHDLDTMDFGVSIGMIEEISFELSKSSSSSSAVLESCLAGFSYFALNESYVERILNTSIIESLVSLVNNVELSVRTRLFSLIPLANLAIHRKSISRITEAKGLEMALRLLVFFNSVQDEEVDFGLTAGFLICRISGERGFSEIDGNENLISKIYWVLNRVIKAGPGGLVLGSYWDPANIVFDVSILARSDENKTLLLKFIPLLIEGLETYGSNNVRLTKYTIKSLIELYSLPVARRKIESLNDRLIFELKKDCFSCLLDLETFQNSSKLLMVLSKNNKESNLLWFYNYFKGLVQYNKKPIINFQQQDED